MNVGQKAKKQKFIYHFQPLLYKDGFWLFEKKEHTLSFISFKLRKKIRYIAEFESMVGRYMTPLCKEADLNLSRDIYWASFSRHQLTHNVSNWYQIFLFSTDHPHTTKELSKYIWLKTAEVKVDERIDWYEKEVINNALNESIDRGMNPINVINWLL